MPAKCLDTSRETVAPLQRNINYCGLLHLVAAVIPAKRDVHTEVCGPKGFATFRWPPNDGKSGICEQSFDQIVTAFRLEPNVLKSLQRECHQCIFAAGRCEGSPIDCVERSLCCVCEYGLRLVVINADSNSHIGEFVDDCRLAARLGLREVQ